MMEPCGDGEHTSYTVLKIGSRIVATLDASGFALIPNCTCHKYSTNSTIPIQGLHKEVWKAGNKL